MKRGRDLYAFLALAFLVIVLTYPLIRHLSSRIPGDLRDPYYTMFAMSWEVRSAAAGFSGFADANIFYPHRETLLYGDALPALCLLGAPGLLLSGGNPVLPYNYLYLLSFFVAGAGMFLLARHLTGSRNAAFLAGVIYAFFPYHFAHISHLEILYMGWMPLCFLFIHKFFERPSLPNLIGMSAFYILQVTSCAYYGEYLTLFAGLMIFYYALRTGEWRKRRFWALMALFMILNAAALGPYLWPFFRIHSRLLFVRPLWEVKFFSAELQHYLAVPTFNVVWGWLTGKLGAQEWQLFPGIVPVALALVWFFLRRKNIEPSARRAVRERKPAWRIAWDVANGLVFGYGLGLGVSGGFDTELWGMRITAHDLGKPATLLLISLALRVVSDQRLRRRFSGFFRLSSRAETFYLGLMLLAGLLSFGPVIRLLGRDIIAGPYALLYDAVPGFKNVRVPSRFAVVMMIGLAALASWGAAEVFGRLRTARAKNGAAALLSLLIIAEFISVPLPLVSVPVGDGIPKIYGAVRALPTDAALIELPMPARDSEESQDAPAVYFSLYHRKNVVNGYSGYAPPGYRVVREAMEMFPSEETFGLLADIGVSHVLVHTAGFRPERGRAIVERLANGARGPELVAAADGDFLYRLAIRPPKEGPAEVFHPDPDRTKWRASASKNPKLVPLAFDGDLATGWTTGIPQRADDFFEFDLGQSVMVRGLTMFLADHPLDYPRNFRVEGSLDGAKWTTLYEKAGFFPALAKNTIEDVTRYVVPVAFAQAAVRFLRMTLTGSHEARPWSINEIVLKR